MEIPVLRDLAEILGIAVVVVLVSRKIGVPSIVGLFLTGMVAGPHGLGLISHVHEVEIMAEIGVVLLLFTIGIEFSIQELAKLKSHVIIGGGLQVGITSIAGMLIAHLFGVPWNKALFYGFLLALSSTAIVLKILQQRAEIDAPHGKSVLGILIFQDIIVVPMMLVAPILAGTDGVSWAEVGVPLLKGILVVTLALVLARWIVPKLLYAAAGLRDREAFILTVVFIGLAVAWLTNYMGLSLALGAFLAGLIISESEFSHQALSDILPFRDIFTSLFFVSIGMLLDITQIAARPHIFVGLAVGVLAIKFIIAGGAVSALGMPLKTAALAGVALSQVGEFSFVLSRVGSANGLMDDGAYQLFLGVSVITMLVTPFAISGGPRFAEFLSGLPLPDRMKRGIRPVGEEPDVEHMADHLIIVGYGPSGRHLAQAAVASSIQYVIIELNPETVRRERAAGQPVIYGDASQWHVLEHAGAGKARVLVVAVPDLSATRRAVELARRMNPNLHIIARTPYIREMEPLSKLGASEVVPAEFETSVEIFTRVLAKYLVPRKDIEHFISEVRAGGYEMFRKPVPEQAGFCDLRIHMPELEINTFRVEGGSEADGKSIAELAIRKRFGTTVLAVRREGQVLSNPDPEAKLERDDVVVLLGSPEDLAVVANIFVRESSQNA